MLIQHLLYIYAYEDNVILSEHEKILIPILNIDFNVVWANSRPRVKYNVVLNQIDHAVKFEYDNKKAAHKISIDGTLLCCDEELKPIRCVGDIDYWHVMRDDNGYIIYMLRENDDLGSEMKIVCLGVNYTADGVVSNSRLILSECVQHDDSQVFHILDRNLPINRDLTLNLKEIYSEFNY